MERREAGASGIAVGPGGRGDLVPLPSFLDASAMVVVACFALLALAALAGFWDAEVARLAARIPPGQLGWWQAVTAFGSSGYMFALGGAVTVAAWLASLRSTASRRRSRWRAVAERGAYVLVCIATSGLAAQAIKHLVGRMRPKFLPDFGAFRFLGPSIRRGADSFPSGHTTSAFAAACALALLVPRWRLPLFAAATLVGMSRVATGDHYPSDVLVGVALGAGVSAAIAVPLARRNLTFRSPRNGVAGTGAGLPAA